MTTLPQTTSVRVPQQLGVGMPASYPVGTPSVSTPGFQLDGATVWRVIRTNLWLLLVFMVTFGVAGYLANMWLLKNYPRYEAKGLLRISRSLMRDPVRGIMSELSSEQLVTEQRTQANMLKHERLFTDVLNNPRIRGTRWFKNFERADTGGNVVPDIARAKEALESDLQVVPIPDSELMTARMKAAVPDEARLIVTELVETHLTHQKNLAIDKSNERTRNLREITSRYDNQLQSLMKMAYEKQNELIKKGMGGPGIRSTKEIELTELIKAQLALSSDRSKAAAEFESLKAEIDSGLPIARIEKAIDDDQLVQRFTNELINIQTQIQLIGDNTGPESPQMKRLQKAIEGANFKLEGQRASMRAKLREFLIQSVRSAKDRTERDYKSVSEMADAVKADLAALGREMTELENIREQEKTLRRKLEEASKSLDELTNISNLQNEVRIGWASGLPETPELPMFPKLWVIMGGFLAVGTMLALGIAFLREFLDDTVRSPRDVQRVGQMSLLGMIADENDDPQVADAKLPIFDAPHSLTAEQFRQVRTRLQHAASLDTMRSIMVTGPSPMDGKTTIAANLAAGLALNGRKILLVDANFRRPEIHRLFGFNNDKGLSDVLNGTAAFEDAVHETRVPNLSVMTSGPKPMNAAELFESQLLIDFIERSVEDYDHVIFDSGPLLVVSESTAMAPRVDGVVTVIRAHSESRGLLQRMRDELRRLKAEHVGVVLNAVRAQGGGYYRRNIKTYYQYQSEA